ncbi:MAG TPA: type II toxin-antitoxin system VapC family toxin [Gaiellaceae bacterium]|nr:type II toxin-antitoxin system VapC family toxin [Gaiellaceae bacterium]
MIVDSSALIAVLVEEPGYEPAWETLKGADAIGIGTPTLVETGMVMERLAPKRGRLLLMSLLDDLEAIAVPFSDAHWPVAIDAFLRFGKGRHAAALNLGDCLTYAVAKVAGEPLLCLGDDFAQTDLALV